MMNRYFAPIFSIFQKYLNNGQERSVKAKKNTVSSILIKGGSIAISLFLVPLTINYVNAERFG